MIAGIDPISVRVERLGIRIPSLEDIGIILAFGAVLFIAMELLKAFLRKKMYSNGKAAPLLAEPSTDLKY